MLATKVTPDGNSWKCHEDIEISDPIYIELTTEDNYVVLDPDTGALAVIDQSPEADDMVSEQCILSFLTNDTGRLPSFPKDLLAYVMASDDGALTPEGQILASAQSRTIEQAGLIRQY